MHFNCLFYILLGFSLTPFLLLAESKVDLIERFLEGELYSYEVSKAVDRLEDGGDLYRFVADYEGSIDETKAVELNGKYDNPELVTRFLHLLYSARLTYQILERVYDAEETSDIADGIYVLEAYRLFDTAISREYFTRNILSNIQASLFFVSRSLRHRNNRNINILPLLKTQDQALLKNSKFIPVWCLFLLQGSDSWIRLDGEVYDKWLKRSEENWLYRANDLSSLIKYIRDSTLSYEVNHKEYLEMCNREDSLGYFFLLYYMHVHHPNELPGKHQLEDFTEKYASSLKEYGLEFPRPIGKDSTSQP